MQETGASTSVESSTASKDEHLVDKADATVSVNLDSRHGTRSDGSTSLPNGQYVVTEPTGVGFKNVNVGAVDLTAQYPVNVKGCIGFGDSVDCTVDYSR